MKNLFNHIWFHDWLVTVVVGIVFYASGHWIASLLTLIVMIIGGVTYVFSDVLNIKPTTEFRTRVTLAHGYVLQNKVLGVQYSPDMGATPVYTWRTISKL